jgi:MFS family permease
MEKLKRSLKGIIAESVITRLCISAPIIIFLWKNDIGMSQAEVGLSQMFFTIAILALEVPTGWLADRFSRKWANFVGDLGAAVGFLLYSQVTSFAGVVMCEVIIGASLAFTSGVDGGLIKNYMHGLGEESKFEWLIARKNTWTMLINIVGMALAGPLSLISIRFVLVIDAVPYIIGAVISLTLVDYGAKLQSSGNALKSMLGVVKVCFANVRLRWMILAIVVGTNVTWTIQWSLTLIFVQAGVPIWLVTISWVINAAGWALGSKVAEVFVKKELPYWQKFLIPMTTALVGLLVIGIDVNLVTIWFYALIGLARGWVSATLTAGAQKYVTNDMQTSFESLTKSLGRVMYIPLSFAVNFVGDFDIRYSFLLMVAIFVVATAIITPKLIRQERR